MPPVRAANGDALQIDAKSRRTGVPRWITDGLAACRRYTPGAVPILMVFPPGRAEPLAILPAEALARLGGFQPPKQGEQLTLSATAPKQPGVVEVRMKGPT